jgi:hypothetical protein
MRLWVGGSRGLAPLGKHFDWAAQELLGDPPATVVHGAARGVDAAAGRWARARGYAVEEFPADWARLGKKAGYVRNAQIAKTEPEGAVFFWDGHSPGTGHSIDLARNHGVPHLVMGWSEKERTWFRW